MSFAVLIEKVVPPKISIPVLLSITCVLGLYVVQRVHAMDTKQAVIDSQQEEILRRLDHIDAQFDKVEDKLDKALEQRKEEK